MTELSLKEIQNESYKVLEMIDDICKKERIQYFLTYGTLLGAVRHNDIIPWDDDIDILMPRPDYERFIEYCIRNKDELIPFTIKHYRCCKQYIYPIARFTNTSFIVEYQDTKDYGLGTFVDIYPIDGIDPNDIKYIKKMKRLFRLIQTTGVNHFMSTGSFITNTIKMPFYLFTRLLNINKLIKYSDQAAQKYPYGSTQYAVCTCWEIQDICYTADFKYPIEHKFRDRNFPIPCGYEHLLEIKYGDYMRLPPEEKRYGHHNYKVYKK